MLLFIGPVALLLAACILTAQPGIYLAMGVFTLEFEVGVDKV